jgi:peptidoglycan hydrolase CwlO-like protein
MTEAEALEAARDEVRKEMKPQIDRRQREIDDLKRQIAEAKARIAAEKAARRSP